MALAAGSRLGPYEIIAPAGAGGMGEVYKARDTRLDRTVAIKVLPSHLSASPEMRQRFEREARAVSALNHPHICTLFDVGHQDGLDYLVLEYLEGETLADRLAKGPLPWEIFLRTAHEIASALTAAHRRGILHRDLKPGNIILTKTGVKLLDFGLAKFKSPAGGPNSAELSTLPTADSPLTAEGSIAGTLLYMAPEQLEEKEPDLRTDIFAFGLILYEMATGRRAFLGKSRASLIASILASDPAPISALQSMAPPALDRLVRTCLAKDPDDRWQDIQDVSTVLQWVAEGGLSPPPAGLDARGGRKRGRLGWAAATVALVLAVIVVGWIVFRPSTRGMRASTLSILPPTAESEIGEAALSPNGRWLAFIASGAEGKRLLWIRSLNSPAARALPDTDDASSPFWSPDSRKLGFFGLGKLRKIEVEGGRPQDVCDAPSGRGATWSRDGIILFGNLSGEGLLKVAANGGQPERLFPSSSRPGESMDLYPTFLPDGRRFLYLHAAPGSKDSGVYLASLDSKEREHLLPDLSNAVYVAPDRLLFVRAGNLVVQRFDADRRRLLGQPSTVAEQVADNDFAEYLFSASETDLLVYQSTNPQSRLVWLDRSGRPLGNVGEPANYVHVDLSPDDSKAAVEIVEPQTGNHDVWIVDTVRGTASRLTFDPAFDGNPIWSPDGTRVVFTSFRGGHPNLYVKRANGAGQEELLYASDQEKWASSWSPDGRSIVFEAAMGTNKPDLWILQLGGTVKAAPYQETGAWETGGQISPDGKWLAYSSDESGRSEVFVQSYPEPGSKAQISTLGGGVARWRRDGKELFFGTYASQLMAVEVETREGAFHAGTPKLLFAARARSYQNRFPYAPSRDGQRFLGILQEAGLPTYTVKLGWTAELKP